MACICKCNVFRKLWSPKKEETPAPVPLLPRPPSFKEKPVDSSKKVLNVEGINFCIKENGVQHNTYKYELMHKKENPCLVVRRGQPFILDLTLNRPYNPDTDAVSFIFTVADSEKPNYGHGTLVAIPLLKSTDESGNSWSAEVDRQADRHLFVKITTSCKSVVAQWKIEIDLKLHGNGAVNYSHPASLYLLFNPWCEKDDVYIEDNDRREEYILQDTGLIWRGTYNVNRPCVWKYAQFEKDILDCSLYLINNVAKMKGNGRSDPIQVSRAVSAAVNSPDDYGALMGNWSDDFGGGKHPTEWIGSMEILQTYYKKKKPVKYGQCWVFAGVLATICRAIGIPCRVVTNFASAHDTHNSLTVDVFVDEKCNPMEELNSDSVWNFHVWNEVWMQRPDLGAGYEGWQVIDATPQELSDNVFRCGPTSVAAIKLGEVQKPYDGGFLFSEVNADKVYWLYAGPTQPLKLLRKDTNSVGKNISTKAVGTWAREDITENYKYPETSNEERATMLKALLTSENLFARYYLNEDFNDVRFDFSLKDDIKIGEPFSVSVTIKNVSSDKCYTVNGNLRVDAVIYTGKVGKSVKKLEFNKKIKPHSSERIEMPVSFNEYYPRLIDQCAFNITCLANVEDTNFEYFAQDDFRVRKPDVKITYDGIPTTGVPFDATIKLENTLPIPLRKGEFHIEGVGLNKMIVKLKENVLPGQYAHAVIQITPPWSGRHVLAAKFKSKELNDVDGFLTIMVKSKSEVNGSRL